jgi:hypothetical protein
MCSWVNVPCGLVVKANISEKHAASIFMAEVSVKHIMKMAFRPEDGDSMLLRNKGFYQPIHMVT